MTEYDAGPGEWSDRPWEDPSKKPKPHAKRRRVALPPWALLTGLVAIIIILCVGLIMVVKAIRGGDGTPTPAPTATRLVLPTFTPAPVVTTDQTPPSPTVVLPVGTPEETPAPTEIGPGAVVVVQGTLGSGLNLRAEPSTAARLVTNVREGTSLTVIEGPEDADGYTWWQLRTASGQEGWGAANWIVLQQP